MLKHRIVHRIVMITTVVVLFLSSSLYANGYTNGSKNADDCETIAGNWRGVWDNPYAHSSSKIDVNIVKDQELLQVVGHATPNGFPNRARATTFKWKGICKDNRIVITDGVNFELDGKIENNEIRLYNENEYVLLNKA